jgi:ribosome-interacting GTPase 1
MLSTVPKHKGTEVLRKQLNQRLSRIRKEQAEAKRRRSGGHSLAVKKEGFQIAIIGFPNTGKSTLLASLTNATPKIAAYPFTTKEPEVGMLDYEGGQIQLVEIPALVRGAAGKQAELMSLVTNSDGIILLADDDEQRKTLLAELEAFGIAKPMLVASKHDRLTKRQVFEHFRLIRIYTKEPGEEPNRERPIILRRGATVLEAAKEVHKDFAEKLMFARVWGSTRFAGQRVEKDYCLADRDVVEFHI